MKEFILPHLICPACLPREEALELRSGRTVGSDIIAGDLSCRRCKRLFPIRDGIALLLPDGGSAGRQLRYSDSETINRYLWSHYGDLTGDPEADTAAASWRELIEQTDGPALDAGCAVGRHLFEAAARSSWAVGCDLSPEFIRTARIIATEGRGSFTLPLEGKLRERFSFELPPGWGDNLEFVVADALALPFARGSFAAVSSLNLLDRVAHPLAHLYEMNRVARTAAARFLCADPFSWTTDAAPEERWLGGTALGPYAGRGVDTVRALLTGKDRVLIPPWNIQREGNITWSMRSHRNHRELIRSDYLLAQR